VTMVASLVPTPSTHASSLKGGNGEWIEVPHKKGNRLNL